MEKGKVDKTITIVIPTLNEEKYIGKILNSVLESDCTSLNLKKILVVDGMSSDKTREIVREFSELDDRIILVDNLKVKQANALNIALELAKTKYLIRLDAHAEYDSNYIFNSVMVSEESGALNVGGAQRFIAETPFQFAVSVAVDSKLGSGGAKYRKNEFSGFADTVWLGCYKPDAVRTVGGFATDNGPNEDSELNYRLNKYAEGKGVYCSSKIKAWYYPRRNLKKMFQQYFRYGRSRFVTFLKHPATISIRALVPFIAFWTMGIMILLIALKTVTAAIAVILLVISIIFGVNSSSYVSKYGDFKKIWKSSDKIPSLFYLIPITTMVIICMNLGHAIGFTYQGFKTLIQLENSY
jgi:glycosyltransferase involved in cell wall biosynthesis